jgi:hypothetical protein
VNVAVVGYCLSITSVIKNLQSVLIKVLSFYQTVFTESGHFDNYDVEFVVVGSMPMSTDSTDKHQWECAMIYISYPSGDSYSR